MATPSIFRDRAADPFDPRVPLFVDADPAPVVGVPAAPAARRRRIRAGVLRGPLLVSVVVAAGIAATWVASTAVLASAAAGVAWLQARNGDPARELVTTVLAAIAALSFVVAWARATVPRRPVRLAGGRGRIAVGEVEDQLRAMLIERPDVVAARVEVENRHRRGLWVSARLDVTPDARLTETLRAATRLTEELVLERLGVALATAPRFDLRYDELDLRAGRAHDFGSAMDRRHDGGGGRGARG